jgi:tetratricopeptide (TPR) repeat protein
MISTFPIDQTALWKEDKPHYHEQLNTIYDLIFKQFDRLMKKHAAFNIFFATICITEIILLLAFFTFFAQSLMLALMLAVVFFSCFAYFTLRLYFQTKKPEQLNEIKERYLSACKGMINYHESSPEHHIALANACCKLANRLHGREYSYYAMPAWLSMISPALEKFSCWCHWQDLHFMKELLLQASVEEHLKLIKCQPINLEAHAALANAYVMLSGLYIDPRKLERYDDERWIPSEKYNEESEKKFRAIAECAIEEFKILNEYAPDDPWVHSQLAYSYHDLQMPLEEIKEYETIYKLNPDDKENLYKLGILYFEQGLNAKGLRIYEELKKSQYQKTESLIKHYGKISSNSR